MEALGIVIVPSAFLIGAVAHSMIQELLVMLVGAVIFWTGHLLVQRAE